MLIGDPLQALPVFLQMMHLLPAWIWIGLQKKFKQISYCSFEY